MMDAPTTDLVRALRVAPEFREAENGDGLGFMSGHVITWDSWYEVNSIYEGHFLERFQRGATKKTISENRAAIKVLYDHGHDPSMGNKILGTLDDLEEDDFGLRYGVNLFDTSYNRDLLPGLKAGVYGSSHRFRTINDLWNQKPERSGYNPDGLPERTITEIGLFELGAVSFPANKQATAGVRFMSMTDEWRSREGLVVPAHIADATPEDPEPATTTETLEPPAHSTARERRLTALRLRGVIE